MVNIGVRTALAVFMTLAFCVKASANEVVIDWDDSGKKESKPAHHPTIMKSNDGGPDWTWDEGRQVWFRFVPAPPVRVDAPATIYFPAVSGGCAGGSCGMGAMAAPRRGFFRGGGLFRGRRSGGCGSGGCG